MKNSLFVAQVDVYTEGSCSGDENVFIDGVRSVCVSLTGFLQRRKVCLQL